MKDILKNWYDGTLFPHDEIVPDDPAYRTASRRVESAYHQLYELLSPEQQEQMKKMSEDMLLVSSIDAYAHFSYGFRLGAALMYELFLQ